MSLSDLGAERARHTSLLGPLDATVIAAPATPDEMLKVEVDTQPGRVRTCPWMPRGEALPAPGDAALVIESDAGELWVIAWWPAS